MTFITGFQVLPTDFLRSFHGAVETLSSACPRRPTFRMIPILYDMPRAPRE